jgi:hypothetical protein
MKNKIAITTAVAFMSIMTVAAPEKEAEAAEFHAHGSYCYATEDSGSTVSTVSNYKMGRISGGGAVTVGFYCPMPDTSAAPDYNVNYLEAYVYDSSASYYSVAQACRTYWDVNGGACGSSVDSGVAYASGSKTLSITDLYEISVTDDLGFIYVLVEDGNLFKGYWGST